MFCGHNAPASVSFNQRAPVPVGLNQRAFASVEGEALRALPAEGATRAPVYVEVAVERLERLFHYRLPPTLDPQSLQPGMRLLVPFGHRAAVAYFVCVLDQPAVKNTKEVLACFDTVSPLPGTLIQLLQWMSGYYFAPLGAVIQCALPKGSSKIVRHVELTESGRAALESGTIQSSAITRALTLLTKRSATYESLRKRVGKDWTKVMRKGWIKQSWDIQISEAQKTIPLSVKTAPSEKPHALNADQRAAVAQMEKALTSGRFAPFLLHGVTGSGKTEVYLHLIEKALLDGKGGLVLVPEIGLTPQLVLRFKERFGETVAMLHSGLSSSERALAWRRIQTKEARVVIGARSALFAPMDNIGVLIVDEEHDSSYKQEEGVRYQARDVALMYGKMLNAVVVLGSATPSMESLYNATVGKYTRVVLPKRVSDRPFPILVPLNLSVREEWVRPFLTRTLVESVRQRLANKEQVILFVNRRGHCPSLLCGTCGRSWLCENCSVALSFHKGKKRLLCHYCGFGISAPLDCPDCHGTYLLYLGVGTEQIEEEIKALFPLARVLRMDRDTTFKKTSQEKIVAAMEAGEADILIGTQMVAKGHDFPRVTLVGVICADHSFNLPDFRASERTFQLLVQVAGRAGRGDQPGEVLLQTFQPEYPLLNLLADPSRYYDLEAAARKEVEYPPYSRLILLRLCHRNESEVAEQAERLAAVLKSNVPMGAPVRILGPAPAPIARIRKDYRYQILLKGRFPAQLRAVVQAGLAHIRTFPVSGLRVIVDVDPQHIAG